MNLKVGDKVVVITGKDKGKEGKIIAKKGEKVLVEGINMVKKHVKPTDKIKTEEFLIEKLTFTYLML